MNKNVGIANFDKNFGKAPFQMQQKYSGPCTSQRATRNVLGQVRFLGIGTVR